MKRFLVIGAGVLACGAGLSAGRQTPAQTPAAPPALTTEVNGYYTAIANYLVRTLAVVPDDKLTWAPTPEVRSFARMFGHIADDNNGACFALAGETTRPARVETEDTPNSAANKMTRAELEKALTDSIALCQKAFATLTPANMTESNGGRGTRTKLGNLMYNTSHINEHYGNLVTYLRLNKITPPSSAGRGGL